MPDGQAFLHFLVRLEQTCICSIQAALVRFLFLFMYRREICVRSSTQTRQRAVMWIPKATFQENA